MSFIASDSAFCNIFSYMGLSLSRNLDDADIFVLGIPYDLATTGRAGTRSGPSAIRQASANLRWEEKRWPWNFAAFERIRVADYGDLELLTGNQQSLLDEVESHVGALLQAGKKVLCFGGDHFVALPLLRAHAAQHGKLAMIHFDAHTDTYSEEGAAFDHGSMFYHAPREGLIDSEKSIQIGIRTEYTVKGHPFEVINAAQANDFHADQIVERIKSRVGDETTPVYLTFDIDCLDPAFAPGTGTPVVGGLTTDKVLKIIRGLQGLNIVGMDVVEVSPAYDHAEITSLAAATLGLEMLYLIASQSEDSA